MLTGAQNPATRVICAERAGHSKQETHNYRTSRAVIHHIHNAARLSKRELPECVGLDLLYSGTAGTSG
jgi:hypothetical protein